MKIDSISIKNYKGFKDCEINFHQNLNVFIGGNGSGKTTLLHAVLKSITNFTSKITHNQPFALSNSDINYNEIFSSITANLSGIIEQNTKFKTFEYAGVVTTDAQKRVNDIYQETNKVVQELLQEINSGPITLPIFKFYPADRGVATYSEVRGSNIYQISQLEAWSNIYFNGLSYSKFFEWYYENETMELRLQRDHKDFKIQSPVLKDVRRALNLAFKELGYGNFTLISKQISKAGSSKHVPALFLKNKNLEENLENKSDGERAIITLIADIAYTLSLAKDFSRDDDFLLSPGIVMIDEIETHLHPRWQREIIPILTKLFPKIQFFIATHSPQVISSVKSENVRFIDNFQVKELHLKTFGEDTNSLLSEIFNATDRPREFVELLEEFDKLMENDAPIITLEKTIQKLATLQDLDSGQEISNLIDELHIRLEAYKFDKNYEEDK